MKHKLIGLYQLITGIFGFIFILVKITKAIESINFFLTFFLGLLLFAGVAYAGYALLNSVKNAVKYSIIAQSLQILSFTYGGIQYIFSCSDYFYILIRNKIIPIFQDRIIDYNISVVSDLLPHELRIYIIPIILVILLSTSKN